MPMDVEPNGVFVPPVRPRFGSTNRVVVNNHISFGSLIKIPGGIMSRSVGPWRQMTRAREGRRDIFPVKKGS